MTGHVCIPAAALTEQHAWSLATFGPGRLTRSITNHIRRELDEVEEAPGDVTEWVDITILAFEGALRAGHTPAQVIAAWHAKQSLNRSRTWPGWTADPLDLQQ